MLLIARLAINFQQFSTELPKKLKLSQKKGSAISGLPFHALNLFVSRPS
jgi:hypothetical protein